MRIRQALGFGLLFMALTGCSEDSSTDAQTGAGPIIAQPPAEQPAVQTAPPEVASPPAVARTGEDIYNLQCKACHDPGGGHPAILLLAEKHGAEKSVIKGREDLTEDYIKSIVRNGLLEMPPFRPTEVTDEELDLIAAYIKQK